MLSSKFADFCKLLTAVLFLVTQSVAQSRQVDEIENIDPIASEPDPASPQERTRGPRDSGKVYKNRVTPNWIDGTTKFWYRNDLPQEAREFIVVDASLGTRKLAFDHDAVAKSLGNNAKSTHLPIERLEFQQSDQVILVGKEKSYRWDAQSSSLTEVNSPPAQNQPRQTRSNARAAAGDDSSITFENRTKSPVEIFWLNGEGGKQSYGKIEAGASRDQHTFRGHRWLIVNAQGESLGEVTAQDSHSNIVIDGRPIRSNPPPRRRPGPGSPRDLVSPDGKWRASIEGNNVAIQQVDAPGPPNPKSCSPKMALNPIRTAISFGHPTPNR